MSGYEFGQRVTFLRRLRRITRTVDRDRGGVTTSGVYREWVAAGSPTPTEGIIVGKRRLANGFRVWESFSDETFGYDGGGSYVFDPAEYIDAYLIAYRLNRSPVLVRPEDITPLEPLACHD